MTPLAMTMLKTMAIYHLISQSSASNPSSQLVKSRIKWPVCCVFSQNVITKFLKNTFTPLTLILSENQFSLYSLNCVKMKFGTFSCLDDFSCMAGGRKPKIIFKVCCILIFIFALSLNSFKDMPTLPRPRVPLPLLLSS